MECAEIFANVLSLIFFGIMYYDAKSCETFVSGEEDGVESSSLKFSRMLSSQF